MLYITGQHALNLPCSLNTCGDWHTSALQWERPRMAESDDSIFGEYGIEHGKKIPEHEELFDVADHIRAILDLVQQHRFSLITDFFDDYICDASYLDEILEHVCMLLPDERVSIFMYKEFGEKWLKKSGEERPKKILSTRELETGEPDNSRAKTIPVKIVKDEDGSFLATNQVIEDVFSTGATKEEAIDHLCRDLIDYAREYADAYGYSQAPDRLDHYPVVIQILALPYTEAVRDMLKLDEAKTKTK